MGMGDGGGGSLQAAMRTERGALGDNNGGSVGTNWVGGPIGLGGGGPAMDAIFIGGVFPTLPMFHVLMCCSSASSCSSLHAFSFSMRARQSAGCGGGGGYFQ